jgi:hypothetical protein
MLLLGACRLHFEDAPITKDATTGDGSTDGTPDAPPQFNRVFVSSTSVDLCAVGVAGADAECQSLATAAGLPGTFVAWASEAGKNARDRIGAARGWRRVDGRPFADLATDLTSGTVLYPPRLDENGNDLGQAIVVSGTNADGSANTGSGCMLGGFASNGGTRWFTGISVGPSKVICLGTDQQTPVSFTPQSGRRIWASTSTFDPSTGVTTADTICAAEAAGAGVTGMFRAWLSTTTQTAGSRLVLTGAVWVRADGVPVVSSTANMTTLALDVPVSQHLDGTPAFGYAWTGGMAATMTQSCNNWTSKSNTLSGLLYPITETSSSGFTATSPQGCSATAGVICLEN